MKHREPSNSLLDSMEQEAILSHSVRKRLSFLINSAYAALILFIGYVALRYAIPLFLPFLIALSLVAVIRPLAKRIQRRLKFRPAILSLTILIALYVLLGSGLLWAAMKVIYYLQRFFTDFPAYVQQTMIPYISDLFLRLEELSTRLPGHLLPDRLSIQESLLGGLQQLMISLSQSGIGFVTALINNLPGVLVTFFFTVMLSFFMCLYYDSVMKFLKRLLPRSGRRFLRSLRVTAFQAVKRYLRAYLILMAVTFAELSAGLLILGSPYALLKAAGIAVFDALPVFGTGGILIPWAAVELLRSNYAFAVGLLILYGVITLVRNLIEPKIVGDQLGLNPVASLVAIYLGYRLFGVLGMICSPILLQIALMLWQGRDRRTAAQT